MTRNEYYGGGSGEADDPYLVNTAEQFNTIGLYVSDWDKHFRLMTNIDLSEYNGEDGHPAVHIIGGVAPYTGVFDGGGHTISNFSYRPADSYCGSLFGRVDGEDAVIKNLILKDVDLSSDEYALCGGALARELHLGTITNCGVDGGTVTGRGGLVGSMSNGAITHCYSKCSVFNTSNSLVGGLVGGARGTISDCYAIVSVTGGIAGGLVGSSYECAITRCHATSNVSGYDKVGGLIGSNYKSEVSHCSSGGTVSGVMQTGGLIGFHQSHVSNCYSTARVEGGDRVGGLVGTNKSSSPYTDAVGSISSCYSTGRVEGRGAVGGLVGRTTNIVDEEPIEASFWDTETSGQESSDGGTGRTTEEMLRRDTYSSEGWDFSTPVWVMIEGVTTPRLWWEPFAGGSGTVDDPYLIASAEQMQEVGARSVFWGMCFRLIADIDLSSYTGSDLNIIGSRNRPFSGVFDGGGRTISNFTFSMGRVENAGLFGVVDGDEAEIRNVRLHNPVVDVSISENVGALVGYLDGTLIECGVDGGSVTGGRKIGGLVGRSSGTISRCFARDDVSCGSSGSYVGGLVGESRGRISDCYTESSVSGRASSGASTGGLIGYLPAGTIDNCFAAGRVSGGVRIGGLVGKNERGRIESCYWNIRTSRVRRMCGSEMMGFECDDRNGKTTVEMMRKITFSGWDFNGIWNIDENNDYPQLQWESE
jgi:hypothetical protein